MQQYMKTKEEYKDCILFYRLGDFYEMFFDDAKIASKELELTLTGKNCGLEERAPMCGVPFHAVEGYLSKLVSRGYKVAICEQVEDPALAKGLVKREVIRVVTPGTNLNAQALDESKNNYIMSIVYVSDRFGISFADVTTGDYFVTEVDSSRKLMDELYKFTPREVICNEALLMSGVELDDLKERLNLVMYPLESWYFDDELCKNTLLEHFHVKSLEGLGVVDFGCGVIAAGALLRYLTETQKTSLAHITKLLPYVSGNYMIIDSSSRRNLELVETLREKQKRGSLLWVLDKTKTAMGARTLRSYLEQPLIDKEEIEKRLTAIEELNSQMITREELREYLNPIYDLERLIGRISYQTANPRDLIAFKASLEMLPSIRTLLTELKSPLMQEILEELDPLEDLHTLVEESILEEPPISIRDGNMIRDGYNTDVDKYRTAKTEGKTWLAEIETKERERTGIKNMKIKFNKVFGYYLEVTNSYKDLVPDDYIRKQTLTNAERYITPELKELEDTILGAEEKLTALEYQLFCEVRDQIASEVLRIQKTAKAVAKLDVFTSLAYVADKNRYVRPKINTRGVIDIRGGRHPVVENMISNDMFISNDTYLDNGANRISIITGPNMAGKSTYMRQTALIDYAGKSFNHAQFRFWINSHTNTGFFLKELIHLTDSCRTAGQIDTVLDNIHAQLRWCSLQNGFNSINDHAQLLFDCIIYEGRGNFQHLRKSHYHVAPTNLHRRLFRIDGIGQFFLDRFCCLASNEEVMFFTDCTLNCIINGASSCLDQAADNDSTQGKDGNLRCFCTDIYD